MWPRQAAAGGGGGGALGDLGVAPASSLAPALGMYIECPFGGPVGDFGVLVSAPGFGGDASFFLGAPSRADGAGFAGGARFAGVAGCFAAELGFVGTGGARCSRMEVPRIRGDAGDFGVAAADLTAVEPVGLAVVGPVDLVVSPGVFAEAAAGDLAAALVTLSRRAEVDDGANSASQDSCRTIFAARCPLRCAVWICCAISASSVSFSMRTVSSALRASLASVSWPRSSATSSTRCCCFWSARTRIARTTPTKVTARESVA